MNMLELSCFLARPILIAHAMRPNMDRQSKLLPYLYKGHWRNSTAYLHDVTFPIRNTVFDFPLPLFLVRVAVMVVGSFQLLIGALTLVSLLLFLALRTSNDRRAFGDMGIELIVDVVKGDRLPWLGCDISSTHGVSDVLGVVEPFLALHQVEARERGTDAILHPVLSRLTCRPAFVR